MEAIAGASHHDIRLREIREIRHRLEGQFQRIGCLAGAQEDGCLRRSFPKIS
jgi:hypothetical protein